MKLALGLVIAGISLLAVVPLVQAATTSSSSSTSSGFVSYGVQVTQNGTTRAISLNESVTPSSSPGKSVLFLSVEATSSNFTFSHIVNSSSTLFPYLPAIANQNFTFSGKSFSVAVKISQKGTSQVTFQGSAYTVTNYAFVANIVSTNGSMTIIGAVRTFPSGLVYSVSAQTSHAGASATLTSTSLPLTATAAAPALQAASAGVGISIAAAAVVLSLGVRMKRKHATAESSKPDHWVD